MDVIIAAIITVCGIIAAAFITPVVAAMVRAKKPHAPLPYHPPETTLKEETNLICNILRERNNNFTGRIDTLDTLRDNLLKGESAALTQVMKGMGGVGKT